jgi:uncharacterized membrane protein YhaH (DUF805 family)
MTFTESIRSGLSRLMEFSGRASRSEYWWFALFLLLVLAPLVLGIVAAYRLSGERVPSGALLVLLVPLALAGVSVQMRRLRDAGLSPWWVLLNLVPYVGVPLVLVLTLWPSRGQEGGETTTPASLSTFSLLMATGWGSLTGAAPLAGGNPRRRSLLPLAGVVLLALAVFVLVYVYVQDRRDTPLPPAPAPAATALPRQAPPLGLIDAAGGASLYYDPSTVRLAGPEAIALQLVLDHPRARERNGVMFHSVRQDEVVDCAARSSSWTVRFYMSEPMGEGAAVLIEESKTSLLETDDSTLRKLRLDTVCDLLPAPAASRPGAADGR